MILGKKPTFRIAALAGAGLQNSGAPIFWPFERFERILVALGPVAGSVGIEGGVVSGVINLESPGVRAPSRRPRHENRYHDA